jgi:hypothetical protein
MKANLIHNLCRNFRNSSALWTSILSSVQNSRRPLLIRLPVAYSPYASITMDPVVSSQSL